MKLYLCFMTELPSLQNPIWNFSHTGSRVESIMRTIVLTISSSWLLILTVTLWGKGSIIKCWSSPLPYLCRTKDAMESAKAIASANRMDVITGDSFTILGEMSENPGEETLDWTRFWGAGGCLWRPCGVSGGWGRESGRLDRDGGLALATAEGFTRGVVIFVTCFGKYECTSVISLRTWDCDSWLVSNPSLKCLTTNLSRTGFKFLIKRLEKESSKIQNLHKLTLLWQP